MQAEPQVVSGRFKPGMNSRKLKQMKIAAKLEELVAEYFPNGGHSVMDANRLKLTLTPICAVILLSASVLRAALNIC